MTKVSLITLRYFKAQKFYKWLKRSIYKVIRTRSMYQAIFDKFYKLNKVKDIS